MTLLRKRKVYDAAAGFGGSRRIGLIVVGAAALLFAVSGVAESLIFSQATTLKYALTVLASLAVIVLAAAKRPAEVTIPAVIVAAPLAPLVFSAGPIHLSVLTALLAVGVVTTTLTDPHPHGSSSMGSAALIAFALILPAVLEGRGQVGEMELFLTAGAVAWLVARVARRPSGARAVIYGIAASASLQSILAVIEFVGKTQINFYGGQETSIQTDYFFNFGGTDRSVGTFFDPISLGNMLAVCLPVLAIGAIVVLREGRRFAAVAISAAAVLTAIGLGLTLSRTSWIGAVLGLFLTATLSGRPWRFRLLSASVFVLLAAVGTLEQLVGPALGTRYGSIFDPTASSVSTAAGDRAREELWHAAEHTFGSHPLFGVGVGNLHGKLEAILPDVGTTTHAHNTFLQLAAEGGLVGVSGLVVLLFGALSSLLSLGMSTLWRAALSGSLTALLICWTTDYTIRYVAVAAAVAPIFGLISGLSQPVTASTPDEQLSLPARAFA